ncbi:MAG: nucleotidyltransferase domain-containing protein [Thermoplasmata archaeon]|nr:nucleotidyltransferase domain-containing protein [Thermoplasmata archaeon]
MMIDEKLRQPIIDFVDRAGEIPNLIGVVLFGSAVTGNISKKSDIDLLLVFDTDHNPEVGEEAKIAREIASNISIKHDLPYPFSFIFVNIRNMKEIEPDFLWNVCKEGILIWGKPADVLMKVSHPSLEPFALVRYSIKDLDEKERRKLLRMLYTSKKMLIDKQNERLGPGIILVRSSKFDKVKEALDRFNVKYSVKKIWMH